MVCVEHGGVIPDDNFGFVRETFGSWEYLALVEVHKRVGCHEIGKVGFIFREIDGCVVGLLSILRFV